jgi:hypothetical protein
MTKIIILREGTKQPALKGVNHETADPFFTLVKRFYNEIFIRVAVVGPILTFGLPANTCRND